MNENIDLTKILKDCPTGTKFYTAVWGEVTFIEIKENIIYPICIETYKGYINLTKKGHYTTKIDAECVLFPSKDQRDWSKFTAPWYKKEMFDPKTLQSFDKVLVRDCGGDMWKVDFYSHKDADGEFPYVCIGSPYTYCIPYNDETKQLAGTTDEAPEYYRYWED